MSYDTMLQWYSVLWMFLGGKCRNALVFILFYSCNSLLWIFAIAFWSFEILNFPGPSITVIERQVGGVWIVYTIYIYIYVHYVLLLLVHNVMKVSNL